MTHRFEQLRLQLVTDDEIDPCSLELEFPTVSIERASAPSGIVIDDYAWRGAFDLRSLDEKVVRAGKSPTIAVRGDDVVRVASEVLTRYQRFIHRTNEASATALFEEVLRAHEGVFDAGSELAKADFEHALDAWQWTLRLNPEVDQAIQLAALFHDIERLESETRERLEHRAPVQQGPRDARARKSADRVFQILTRAGVPEKDGARVRDILNGETSRVSAGELLLLTDADGLSFLSLGSSGYVDYFGVAQTRRKVAFTLARLGPRAKQMLDTIHLRPDVERLLHEIAA